MSLDSSTIILGIKEWFIDHVEGPKVTRPRYIAPQIPLQGHGWFFEELFMALEASRVYLGPNVQSSSMKLIDNSLRHLHTTHYHLMDNHPQS